uniref:Uncharacterized protein n=1 Tax=Lactuca sativa TaxID=4236 RepID=A0A9R1VUK6_LACSA|nr:hypothetical protein LSAT_V11C400176450 [Lactuca sativa]
MRYTRDDLTLKVCVINIWKHMCFYNKDEIWSIELILVDERNLLSIQKCFKRRDDILHHMSKLCNIKEGSFRLTPQDHKLTFLQETVNFPDLNLGFHLLIINLYSHWSIRKMRLPVNIIGFVVAIGKMMQDDSDKSKHRPNIRIQDVKLIAPVLTHTLRFQSCSLTLTSMKFVFLREVDISGVIFALQDLGDKARYPRKGEKSTTWKDKSKWCAYHEEFGHVKEDCIALKKEISYLMGKGYLKEILGRKKGKPREKDQDP